MSTRLPPPSTHASSFANHASFSAVVYAPVPVSCPVVPPVKLTFPVHVGSAAAQLSTCTT